MLATQQRIDQQIMCTWSFDDIRKLMLQTLNLNESLDWFSWLNHLELLGLAHRLVRSVPPLRRNDRRTANADEPSIQFVRRWGWCHPGNGRWWGRLRRSVSARRPLYKCANWWGSNCRPLVRRRSIAKWVDYSADGAMSGDRLNRCRNDRRWVSVSRLDW